MQCEICNAEIESGALSCSQCGAPVLQNVEGFENTVKIQRILHTLIVENFSDKQVNVRSLTALLRDYLADYKPEQRLLIYAINSGILRSMLSEGNRTIAIMRARTRLISECFVSAAAAEFVLACLTYMLKWEFEIRLTPAAETVRTVPESAPAAVASKNKSSSAPDINAKIFKPLDAVKYRLTKHIVIKEGYTQIEGFCFDKYSIMRSIKLPSTMIALGEYAFSSCKKLQTIELPDSVRIIRAGAFSQCSELVSIAIPHGVLAIEDNTFMCCEALASVVIPSTVSSIGLQAFSGCENLKVITLPDSVKYIDDSAFLFCPELTVKCYENSYAHKFCLSHGIKTETVTAGMEI
ncbi:MAG: leucine-rich repeat domain-containing protein [Ruminococcus sp.]|nr:leucine-rich repeat domain-containing protein [Ruminococcus sp.]MDE6784254.1 leucine-rich repeat domain-containing protein [Ruminococcus sp.]